ncbi:MAG: L-threonylcarbamoyladenylate synthase [Roseobacter sp.]|jgi:L-threonylcarbamoyladenylate synthase|nr:L-threonylcarbamoyladenylate synthase [Roseobacter sp.]
MSKTSQILLTPCPADIARAAGLLADGELVAFPTETVYGLGADARDNDAVARIYAAKGRPSFNPLIVHVADAQTARRYGVWSAAADLLADRFWPGALTLVLPLASGHGLSPLVTADLPTVALRVPQHATARALLRVFDGPVAAPSANPSGRISPTTAQHVRAGLGDRVAAVLDDGPCAVGLESTIIGLDGPPRLLRAGGIATEAIETVLQHPLESAPAGAISAPGQLLSHYAPRAQVRLNAAQPRPGEVFLGFGDIAGDINLSRAGDLEEAARHLFDALHRLDATGQPIAVAPIPQQGLGIAINDRLSRAAAPR